MEVRCGAGLGETPAICLCLGTKAPAIPLTCYIALSVHELQLTCRLIQSCLRTKDNMARKLPWKTQGDNLTVAPKPKPKKAPASKPGAKQTRKSEPGASDDNHDYDRAGRSKKASKPKEHQGDSELPNARKCCGCADVV